MNLNTHFLQIEVVNNFHILAFSDEGNTPDIAGKANGDEQQTTRIKVSQKLEYKSF